MAATLQAQLQKRLANPKTARDYDSKMKAGTGEKILNWLGPLASIGGQMRAGGEQQVEEGEAPYQDTSLVSRMLQPNIDISQRYRPRIDSSRIPRPDEDTSWLVDGMQGTGQPTKPRFSFGGE
jgi:hypothetical protein